MDTVFLRNSGIYQRVNTASKPEQQPSQNQKNNLVNVRSTPKREHTWTGVSRTYVRRNNFA
jgi:DNA-binding protein H-NS